ncbi:procollagen-lysine,2-oxoglutarate 5-dioxygenase 1-like [Babylonia areolata]|uniref:procollagen-lysine,2-oxoglutarate 5-dioxygenase 1-like n=1 Tax=Babylonia areolata TaxID=304850 RepID=UPI003FD30850
MLRLLFLAFMGLVLVGSTLASEPDLLLITVATDETDGLKRFLHSTRKYGLKVKVAGMGEKWKGGDMDYPGGGHKVNLLKKEVEKYKETDNLVIMFTDSYDVVFTEGAKTILERFAKFDARVVFSAEGFCWPDSSLKEKYPPVKASEKRFLNSGGFMGYAPELHQILQYSALEDSGDDQGYYTSVFLDRALRGKLNIKLDTRSEIFQNLHGALGDVLIKYRGNHSYLYNVVTGTSPVVIHGNGPIKVEFNRLANYLADGWTSSAGCLACQEDTISLQGVKPEDYPTVLMGLFMEQPTPFIREFFQRIAAIKYPKARIDLYIHNKEEYHRPDVSTFIEQHGKEYHSVINISPSDNIGEIMGRNWGIEECIKRSCQYYFAVDSIAQLTDPDVLVALIQQNRSILAPILTRPYKLWSNFWGALNNKGFYARSEDYMDIVEDKKLGLWNVPFVTNAMLIQGHKLKDLRNAYNYSPDLDPDMSFCRRSRDLGHFMYATNIKRYGHLVHPDGFETFRTINELYNIFENPFDWEARYLHESYAEALEENAEIEMPCPDVYWFPVMSDTFCDEFVAVMSASDQWSDGSHSDPRLAGGYENVPTVDLHMNQVGYERHWLHILDTYIRPLQEKVFIGYFHRPPHSIMNFIVRYRPHEQPSLRPHHDSSTYTINIALNRPGIDFEGGGCRFIRYNCSITSPRKGWMFMHPGRLTHYHEGLTVTNGTRYIMISFVDP